MGLYVDKEVSLNSVEKAKHLVGWGCKVILTDLQKVFFESSSTEDRTGAGKAIFEGGFKFLALLCKE